jgi:cell filamentation protein
VTPSDHSRAWPGSASTRRLARARYLTGRDREAFVAGLAEHLGDVIALHPFREGNGRVQRAFVGQLARDAG